MKRLWILLIYSLTLAVLAVPAGLTAPAAQQSGYALRLNRDFGFSSGSKIRGKFTVSITGDMDVVRQVRFLIDGQEMALVTAAPFRYTYQTDDYGVGWHAMSAEVTLNDGSLQTTPERRFLYVSQEDEFGSLRNILIPLGGILLLVTLLGVGGPLLFNRNRPRPAPGAARSYGLRGGAICPRCHRPFAIHLFTGNLGLWKLDRCDNCGRVGLFRRASIDALRAAEAAEKEAFNEPAAIAKTDLTPEEELRRQIDDSRYTE